MTIKEASVKFNIDEKEIRNRKRDNMIIGVRKDGRTIVIPNDTILIPSKKDIQSFLFQIIKYKNNPSTTISRGLCPNSDQLEVLINYLYKRGFIGQFDYINDISELFRRIQLTEDGFSFVFGVSSMKRIASIIPSPLQLNPSINISAIKVG